MANRRGYSTISSSQEPTDEVHPIWRGFGCLLSIIIPVMSFAGAMMIVDANRTRGWFTIPNELSQPVPAFLRSWLPTVVTDFLYVKLIIALGIALLLFGLYTFVYSMIYGMGGGYRSSPVDAPPIRRKTKKSR